ncbi:MAG: DNA-directed RNA polymerase subunit D [Thermoplasmatota archaeon]
MKIQTEILELSDRHAKFVVEGVHPYFVNALRRVLLAEVPKLAIDKVTLYDNTSALFDEIVAHRLGLLPIPTDPSTLSLAGRVDDEGNPEYLVRFTLTKEGPCTVYSGDLECDDASFLPADPKIPIVELLAGQRLILEAEAVLGMGTQHAKWQASQAVGYKYYPQATVDAKKISKEDAERAVAETPAGILGMEGDQLVILKPDAVNRADDIQQFLGDAFEVTYNDRKFIFRFETDGALKAEDALLKAVEILTERFKAFRDAIADL